LNQNNSKKSKQNILNYFNNIWIILGVICVVGFFLRIIWIPHEAPITLDGSGYFWYAIHTSITGSFPNAECGWKCTFPNTGWASFLSIFFMIFSSDNYLDYMNLQRYLGVIISVVTIIPMYYFCKVFVEKKYAIIAGILFTFNPRIIENSILGITEPLYILSILLMLYTFFQHGKNYPYITFGIIGIISIVRYEGLLLFVPISLLYFYRFRFSKRIILKYFIAITIFFLIIISWGMMKIDLTGSDGIISNVSAGPIYYSNVIKDNQDPNEVIINFLKTGILNMFKFLGLSTLPLLTFLMPLGIYIMISKKKLSDFLILFSIVIVLLMPAFYAYSRNFQEVRYLLPILPIFCLFSIYFIKNITEKIKYKKLFLILISILIISSTVGFIEYKNSNDVNRVEAYQFAKEVTKLINSQDQYLDNIRIIEGNSGQVKQLTKSAKVITYYSQAQYLDNIRIVESNKFPILREELPQSIITIYPDKYETFQEYISNNNKNGLEYVIVDQGDWRTAKFLDDVFQNEENYPYLHKIFDSKDIGYENYHAKIFRINFDEFNTFKSMES